MRSLAAAALLVLIFTAVCPAAPPMPAGAREWIWEGEIAVDELLEIPREVTLQLRPGTVLRFAFDDRDGDGHGDNGLHVLGSIVAIGTAGKPVVFTSAAAEPAPGDWQGLLLDESKGNLFENVLFEYARHALHTHFSEGRILRSRFERNMEGTRLGDSRFEIAWSLIADNESKGLNFRACANHIHHNTITRNGHGIFLFETDTESVIEKNNLLGNEGYEVRLGDFYEGGLSLRQNWWGTADEKLIRDHIFAGDETPDRERVTIDPAADPITTGW
jgi:parallel beta-helix repeat protein